MLDYCSSVGWIGLWSCFI